MKFRGLMSQYLLIETRSSWEGRDVREFLKTAGQLRQLGHVVHVFLIQNGVIMAKPGAEPFITDLLKSGIGIWADDFSISNRNLKRTRLLPDVKIAGMDQLVKFLTDPEWKTIWH